MLGALIINKPLGPTSFDIVAKVRRAAHMKRVGHAGTLDPQASGVLVVCVGAATRVIEYLMEGRKQYRATVVFGVATDSEDATGTVIAEADCSGITRDALESVLPSFIGTIMQTPPMVSAVHHNGRRLYEIARSGETVEREARPITIYDLKLLDFTDGEHPQAVLDVECSKGTYIRTLCADLGSALGCPAHMSALVRTRAGKFGIDAAISLETMEEYAEAGKLEELVHPVDELLEDIACVRVPAELERLAVNGVALDLPRLGLSPGQVSVGTPVRIQDADGELIGIGKFVDSGGEILLHPEKVFAAG